ncbi:MAG: hypothetical protein QOJ26_1066 [Thermoplasmata archaeon]|nr:hypothetical protein [Thermoplasmata archaeon]
MVARFPVTLLSVAGALLMVCAADAQVPVPQQATLEPARAYAPAVWDGEGHAYLFGGLGPGNLLLDQIVKYTPATDQAEVMAARLPVAVYGASAVWDGEGHAYVFGGRTTMEPQPAPVVPVVDARQTNQILRYTPATDTLEVMPAVLPTPRYLMAAIWDGAGHAYLFGGYDSAHLATVVEYTPATAAVTTLDTALPGPLSHLAAVSDGQGNAYIFGGYEGSGRFSDEVLRFDGATKAISVTGARLPTARESMSVVWSDGRAFVFGGGSRSGQFDDVLAFRPATAEVEAIATALPVPSAGTAAVWDPSGTAYVFGGTKSDGMREQIIAFDLDATTPGTVVEPEEPSNRGIRDAGDDTAGQPTPEPSIDGGSQPIPGPGVLSVGLLLALATLSRRV